MTLVLDKMNSKMKNLPFDEKRDMYYKSSSLEINKKIIKCKKWTSAEIIKRQNELSDLTAKIWKL